MLAADDPEEPPGYRGRRRRVVPLAARIAVVGTVALLAVIGVAALVPDGEPASVRHTDTGNAPAGAQLSTTRIDATDPAGPAGTGSSPARPAPAWQANHRYEIGDRVSYAGHGYQCLQAHTSLPGWEPLNAPALWQPLP